VNHSHSGPLTGIKVLEFGSALTAPWAAGIMRDQGAEVIKVEPPGIGDIMRFIGSNRNGITTPFQVANRDKKSVVLDIRNEQGLAIARDLVADADVVIHNMRAGVMERLGLGYQDCCSRNSDIVYCAISGFGHKGPMARHAAYDNVIQAFSGICWSQANLETGEPVQVYQLFADKLTAVTAAQSICAALVARGNGQGGQEINLSMSNAVSSFLWLDSSGTAPFLEDGADEGLQVSKGIRLIPFEGGYAQCAPVTDAQFIGMFKALGEDVSGDPILADLGQRTAHSDYTTRAVEEFYRRHRNRHVDDVIARWEREDVPCCKAMHISDLPSHPQMQAMGSFVETDHPQAGRIIQPCNAPDFEGTPAGTPGIAPALGQHTDEVLGTLGHKERIPQLRADGIVG
jgi:crotonobetainyl-CoA:carnitine CoA-transferase CaiB-like acyl-CoA transferase